LALQYGIALGEESGSSAVDFESQEKVIQLLQTVIQDYWHGAAATNGAGNSTNVEAAFRQACALMPSRLDLRFDLASSLVSQAVQTNGPQLETKLNGALQVYRDIEALNTNSFEAPILYAAYTRAMGESNQSNTAISRAMSLHPQLTTDYVERFRRLDLLLEMIPNSKAPKDLPRDNHHVIVILGAGLETNGTIKPKLVSRLRQGLKLARLNPAAPIILTGGNQKAGITEAYAMSQWLAKRGVRRKRLYLDDKARDTVENALFSCEILKRLGATHVTLVTSSNHIRRGLADLQEACLQRGLNLQFDSLAANTKGDLDLDMKQERLGVYRDVMRTSGLWAYPGLQR
jgi:uncharacterized SAM-binding protein YcdF (DUF218 family)